MPFQNVASLTVSTARSHSRPMATTSAMYLCEDARFFTFTTATLSTQSVGASAGKRHHGQFRERCELKHRCVSRSTSISSDSVAAGPTCIGEYVSGAATAAAAQSCIHNKT